MPNSTHKVLDQFGVTIVKQVLDIETRENLTYESLYARLYKIKYWANCWVILLQFDVTLEIPSRLWHIAEIDIERIEESRDDIPTITLVDEIIEIPISL